MLFHLIRPIVDLKLAARGLQNYFSYIRDLIRYKKREENLKLNFCDLNPQLYDNKKETPVDYHYFYQQIWVFEKVLEREPTHHLDVGSTGEMSAYLAQIVPTTFVDLRPIDIKINNLKIIRGDITELPFDSNSQESVSSLHVVEHIGLGRYGDKLDTDGTRKACRELARVLKPGGQLYLSVPIGRERVCFNAHRIFHPQTIFDYFGALRLVEFSVIDDEGRYLKNVNYRDFADLDYGCGLFLFKKRETK